MNLEEAKRQAMMMVKVGMVLWIVGFVMVLSALYIEFFGSLSNLADSTSSRLLMSLKLGGIGFILSGIFLSLVAIVKALAMMPLKLAKVLKGRK